ncbi:MAG: T9SS type A sorting domain-containing protein [Ignavibacteriota bacterium]
MKIYFIIITLCCSTIVGYCQGNFSNCSAPDSVVNLYSEDAAKIAFGIMIQRSAYYHDSINIPQTLQDTFLRALIAVHNSRIPASDTMLGRIVLSNFHGPIFVHANYIEIDYTYSFRRLRIKIDTTVQWEKNIAEHKIPSGNHPIDSLMNVYGIGMDSVTSFYQKFKYLSLHTKSYYNIAAIAEEWNKLSDTLTEASPISFATIPNGLVDIKATIEDSNIHLTYLFGWGDCPSGCNSTHYWSFTIYPDCSVTLDSSYGSRMFSQSVSANVQKNDQLNIYPNPGSQDITVEVSPQTILEIFDLEGKLAQRILCTRKLQPVSLPTIPRGIFVIKATDKQGEIKTTKFIKN